MFCDVFEPLSLRVRSSLDKLEFPILKQGWSLSEVSLFYFLSILGLKRLYFELNRNCLIKIADITTPREARADADTLEGESAGNVSRGSRTAAQSRVDTQPCEWTWDSAGFSGWMLLRGVAG
jgi:hypothetical protein